MTSRQRIVSLALLGILSEAGIANAQVHPNVERGVAVDKMYQLGGLDEINVFNGNLSLRIPMGGSLPVSDHLSYGLTLIYNSKVWDSEIILIPDGLNDSAMHRIPTKLSNAGFGWKVTLGTLLDANDIDLNPSAETRYEAADGSSHVFFGTLHPTDSSSGSLYTRDNSYLRLTPSGSNWLLEFPDGTIHEFESYNLVVNSHSVTRWRVHEIRDRFGNHIDLDYSDSSKWVITDQYGRKTTIHFTATPDLVDRQTADPPIDPHYLTVVDYIDVPAFVGDSSGLSGAVTPSTTARYAFSYNTLRVRRSYCSGETKISTQYDPANVVVPLLTTIQLPDGTSYIAAYQPNPTPTQDATCPSGEMINLQLPTYGQLQWTYRDYKVPTKGCGDVADAVSQSSGVATRSLFDPTGKNTTATWTYNPQLTPEMATEWRCGPGPSNWQWGSPPSDELKVTVSAPTGDQTVHFFSVWPPLVRGAQPDPGASVLDFGLPFSPKVSKDGKFISTQTYQGAVGGSLKRTTYVRYERDDGGITFGVGGDPQYDVDRRLADSRTEFNDDLNGSQPHYVEMDSTDFDGVGHYRTITETGTFLGSGGARTTTTAYNTAAAGINASDTTVIATGTYQTGGGSFVLPPASAPWIVNLFASRTVTEGSASATMEYCFAPATGFLRGMRTIRGASISNTDLIQAFVSDPASAGGAIGNATAEKYYGGDSTHYSTNGIVAGTPITSTAAEFCTMVASPDAANPGMLGYDIRDTFTFGVRNTTSSYSNNASVGFKTLDSDIDGNTALTFHSRDTSGVQTGFVYDTSRRLTSLVKPGTASITYTYANATQTSAATFTAQQASPTAGTLRYQAQFDFLGRKALESRLMPPRADCSAQCLAYRQTKYNGMGWTTDTSEWEYSATPSHFTTMASFDPFGRPGTISKPDFTHTDFTYAGARQTSRTSYIGTITGLQPEITTETYDVHGRLYTVAEPGPNTATGTYTYDIGNRLASASVAGGTPQARSFTYDNAGLLLNEQQPESGTVAYGGYDARGHVGFKTLSDPNNQCNSQLSRCFNLAYGYDAAERVTMIGSSDPLNSSQFRISKQFAYGVSGLSNGKLITAIRHNYHQPAGQISFSDIAVTEGYSYRDTAGHLTDKTTTISSNELGSKVLSQSYHYNDVDLVDDVIYPTCDPSGCGSSAWGDVVRQYTNGLLSAIAQTAFASGISYWPSGMPNVITHATSVFGAPTLMDTYSIDTTNMMARAKSVTFGSWTNSCVAPSITVQPGNATMSYGNQETLRVTASGTSLTYQWFQNGSMISGAIGSSLTVSPQIQSTQYSVRVLNGCGRADSNQATLTVLLPQPGQLHVATLSTNTLRVTWNGVSGEHYELWRLANNSWTSVPNVVSPFSDAVAANTTYVYQVRATLAGFTPSPFSSRDLGTTVPFGNVIVGGDIFAADVTKLLSAVNAVRAAAGSAPLSWSQILPAGTPAPDSDVGIYASHITSLRSNMDSALQALQLPISGYRDANLTDAFISAFHVTDLQDRARHTQ